MGLLRRKGKHRAGSPFDADVIKPGDPGWDIFQACMNTGGAVVGIYNAETGDVVSIQCEHGTEVGDGNKCRECDSRSEQTRQGDLGGS